MTDTPEHQPASEHDDELEQQPTSKRGYVAESFGEFFGDPTWLKRTLIGALLYLVPIAGSLAVQGYALEWMRATAWDHGDTMPRNPEPGETMMSGLRVWGVQLAWGLLGIIPLIIGTIAGVGVMLSFIGSALAPDSGAITSPAFSWVGQTLATIVILAGLALYIACMILASAGVARVALYGRAKAGLPLNGVLAFAKLNGWGFWKALGTSLLAMLPLFAWTIAVEWWLGAYQGDRPSFLVSYTLFLPAGLVWFPARLISARAWGRWLREIGPGTLPALESRPPASSGSEAYTGEAEPLPEPSSDPFSDAD